MSPGPVRKIPLTAAPASSAPTPARSAPVATPSSRKAAPQSDSDDDGPPKRNAAVAVVDEDDDDDDVAGNPHVSMAGFDESDDEEGTSLAFVTFFAVTRYDSNVWCAADSAVAPPPKAKPSTGDFFIECLFFYVNLFVFPRSGFFVVCVTVVIAFFKNLSPVAAKSIALATSPPPTAG